MDMGAADGDWRWLWARRTSRATMVLMRHRHSALLLLAAAISLGPAMAAQHCIILQYHHFSTETPPATSIAPARFEAQLAWLAAHDYRVLPLREVAAALVAGGELPERCAAITMDDAYASTYREAFPRLAARGWPFTVFVSTDAVDAGRAPYLGWAELREMAAAGAGIENHGASHDHLIRRRPGEDEAAWAARVRGDITRAGRRIAAEIGTTASLFAYPYGEFDPALKALVHGLGLVGLGQQSGPAGAGSDPGALPRFPMSGPYGAMADFATKLRTVPMPLRRAQPEDPVVPLDEWRPALDLVLERGRYNRSALRCYVNGSPEMTVIWSDGPPPAVTVRPRVDLQVGRNRYNCTLPAGPAGVYHWYSHNWFRRHPDGRWYEEP